MLEGTGLVWETVTMWGDSNYNLELWVNFSSIFFTTEMLDSCIDWMFCTGDTKLMNNLPSKFWQQKGCYKYYYFCGNVHLSIFHPFFARFLFLQIEMWMRGLVWNRLRLIMVFPGLFLIILLVQCLGHFDVSDGGCIIPEKVNHGVQNCHIGCLGLLYSWN